MLKYKIILSLIIVTLPFSLFSRQRIADKENDSVFDLFSEKNTIYTIKYQHNFKDTLFIPSNCKLDFKGGGLSGPIVFNNTRLCGDVNLKGSSLSGSINNKCFVASWVCFMDGVTDDAPVINQMIDVCGNVFFPKGQYRLVSPYFADDIEENLRNKIHSHLGINRSNVTLRGEKGVCLLSSEPLGILSIYSQPNDIDNSITNIVIDNLSFKVLNDGINFHEFMLTIETMGVNGLDIKNCFFDDFWGDAICLSHFGDNATTGERTRNENIRILNNIIVGGEHHNNRNGISIINGKNVLIENNVIKNTSRENMPGGIDVEPNNSAYTINNIQIKNNIIEGVRGSMGAIGIVLPHNDAPAYGVYIVNNKISNCSWGISVRIATNNTSSDINIIKNYIADDTNPYNFGGKGSSKNWIIKDNYFGKYRSQRIPGNIKVDNLVVKNNKKKD